MLAKQFLAKLFLYSFVYVMGMAISVQFIGIFHDSINKISREFSIIFDKQLQMSCFFSVDLHDIINLMILMTLLTILTKSLMIDNSFAISQTD